MRIKKKGIYEKRILEIRHFANAGGFDLAKPVTELINSFGKYSRLSEKVI